MIKAIPFTNIHKGILFIKLIKNQKLRLSVVSIKPIATIQSAFNAIYGQITKLKTVIGIRKIKYNFSVLERLLKET